MFFRKKPSNPPSSASPVVLKFEFMPDIMILEPINTPSGMPLDIEIHEHPALLTTIETLPPELFPPTVDHSHTVEVESISTAISPEAFLANPPGTETITPGDNHHPTEITTVEPTDRPSTSNTIIPGGSHPPEITSSAEQSHEGPKVVEPTDSYSSSNTIIPVDDPKTDIVTPVEPSHDSTVVEATDSHNSSETIIPVDDYRTDIVTATEPSHDDPKVVEPTYSHNTTDIASTNDTIISGENHPTEITPLVIDPPSADPEPDLSHQFQDYHSVIGGTFIVGDNPQVAIDWLYDGGGYNKSQMGIFLLNDLEGIDINSPEFTNLALHHITSNSQLGHVVINDALAGAKFDSPENDGSYSGLKIFDLKVGGTYGIALIPNGTFEEALAHLTTGEELSPELQPLFSLIPNTPSNAFPSGLLVDVTGDGNTFIMEDMSPQGYSDLDFNDLIFQVRGMTGTAVSMDELLDYNIVDLAKDWRTSDMGQALVDYVTPYVVDISQVDIPEIPAVPREFQPLIGVIDTGFARNNPYLDYSQITWGSDFIDHDADPTWQAGQSDTTTGNEHGTYILGEIQGLDPDAPIHGIRAVGSGHWAEALTEFVDTAQASGQPNAVVNLSMDLTRTFVDGGDGVPQEFNRYELTPQERAAIAYAQEHHVLMVVSAGNTGLNEGEMRSAWGAAAREFDNILVVGAASPIQNDYGGIGSEGTTTATLWDGSSFSSHGVHLVAAGGTLENPELSTVGDGLGTMAGTSVATAQVTAAAAQVWAVNPELSYGQVKEILQATATDLNWYGWDQYTGAGLLNVAAAVQLARVTIPEVVTPVTHLEPPAVVPNPGGSPTIPGERPAGAFGAAASISLESAALTAPEASVVSRGLSALGGLLASGGVVLTSPAVLAAGTVLAVGAIVAAGTAYYQLKQAEAEAAANTAANTWCQANLQRCHTGEAGMWAISYSTRLGGGSYQEYYHYPDSNWAIEGVKNPSVWCFGQCPYTYNVFRPPSDYKGAEMGGGGLINRVDYGPPKVEFRPATGTTNKTWNQLSAEAQQEIFNSGALTTALSQAALSSGAGGILAPGDLAGQGLGNLTVFGAGNTVGVVSVANLSPYGKDGSWKFRLGKGWVFIPTGSTTAYFPNNIPAAIEERNGPPTWTEGTDGIGEWIFRADSGERKTPKTGSGKDKATDVPSWLKNKGERPYKNENGKTFAKRVMDEKYGPGNYPTGPGTEYNKIQKYGDRGFI